MLRDPTEVRVCWAHALPDLGDDAPDSSQAPLHWDGEAVLLPIAHWEHDSETRAVDATSRGSRVDVHRIHRDGAGAVESFAASSVLISQSWSFLRLGDDLVLHVGSFHRLPGGGTLIEMPFADASNRAGRGVFLQHDDTVIFTDSRKYRVHCHEVQSKACRWMLDLPDKHRYPVGPIAIDDGKLACRVGGALSYLDPSTGEVERQQTFPRIDVLFPPVAYEGDVLFAYRNWTSGGLLRFDSTWERIAWKFSKRAATAPPRGAYVVGPTAIVSINDGSSLVGVDLETGQARWTVRTQWVYTPIEIAGRSILFGTAGARVGHLRRHDSETGETEWAVEMQGGCAYYTTHGDHIVAGDSGGVLRRIRRSDGEVVDRLDLGAPITTAPLVVGDDIYALRWPSDGTAPSLVAVKI